MDNVQVIAGDESENDWYACPNRDTCGHIGIHNGVNPTCPNCRSVVERFHGDIFVCDKCGTEHISRGDAEDCCPNPS